MPPASQAFAARVDVTSEDAPRAARFLLFLAFFASGASAIVCQVAWQRILMTHGGMDTHSTTTTVAAFMLGLGIGNLAGGALGDRLSPARCFLAYLLLEAAIAALAWSSPYVLYDAYGGVAHRLSGAWEKFAAELGLLVLPTMLMGATLPIAARALVRSGAQSARIVGRLYGANTLGAAAGGLAMAGPLVLGAVGISGALQLAAGLNSLAAVLVAAAVVGTRRLPAAAETVPGESAASWSRESLGWIAIYGLTGFISLSLEMLWFRVLQVLLLGTTFTFAALLSLFLLGLGAGAWIGSGLAATRRDPQRTFLRLQFVIAQAGLLGPALLFGLVRAFGLPGFGTRWVIAALVVVPPAMLMGAAFPILQRIVARDVASLGRHTGALLFANTAGAFAGVTVTGLVLLDHLGTPRTLTLLATLALVFEVAIWHRRGGTARAWRGLAAAVVVVAAMAYLCPEPGQFWAALHATPAAEFHAREDSTCLAALKLPSPAPDTVQAELAVNGKWQGNPYPFFTFHMNLGLLPALLAERPERALVIGLGIGSTAATQVAEPRIRSMDVVEICAGEERLLRGHLGDQPEFARLFSDPRVRFHVADGRRFLMLAAERFDLIVTDTLLPQWSGSGGLYSQEFYRLVASRLSPHGVLAQWMVTPRTALTAASVFPHVLKLRGPTLRSGVLLMSRRALHVDRKAALADLERLVPHLSPRERGVARRALIDLEVSAVRAGGPPPAAAEGLNTDLFPRDEYSDNWLRRQWKRR